MATPNAGSGRPYRELTKSIIQVRIHLLNLETNKSLESAAEADN
jgi:hypothetical protein